MGGLRSGLVPLNSHKQTKIPIIIVVLIGNKGN